MERVYCIGKFQFDSYDRYREALQDVDKIRTISKKMDINEPGVAQKLYSLIREGKIVFKTEIGDDYLLYLGDMVAEDYKELSHTTLAGGIMRRLRKLSAGQVVGAVCMAGALLCFLVFIGSEFHDRQKARELEELRSEQQITAASDWIAERLQAVIDEGRAQPAEAVLAESGTVENGTYSAMLQEGEDPDGSGEEDSGGKGKKSKSKDGEASKDPDILPEYESLYEQNADFVGWITAEGVGIDYPVLRAVPESSDFYLDHDFYGKEDINGSIFMDSRNGLDGQDDNLIIYGHNMKSGEMFGNLEKYLDEPFYQSNKTITFNTIYEKSQYEIIAVCLSKAEKEGEGFHYYDFIKAGNKKAFRRYIKNIEKLNVMGGEVDASYGDKLLTLSTCNNYTQDGRLFLVAKKIAAESPSGQ